MRLVLDEMWNAAIASELRRRGHDVIATQEPEHDRYAGTADSDVFALAQQEARTIVTDNIVDYEHERLVWESMGRDHHGVIYALDPPFNRHRESAVLRQMVRALDAFLDSDDARTSQPLSVHYLRRA